MYHLYILENAKGRHYIGMSADVAKRILAHNSGRVRSTRPYRPWRVIYSEACKDRNAARTREVKLKTSFSVRDKIMQGR